MAICTYSVFFFFNDTATTEIYTYSHTLSLHDALPILGVTRTTMPAPALLCAPEAIHAPSFTWNGYHCDQTRSPHVRRSTQLRRARCQSAIHPPLPRRGRRGCGKFFRHPQRCRNTRWMPHRSDTGDPGLHNRAEYGSGNICG